MDLFINTTYKNIEFYLALSDSENIKLEDLKVDNLDDKEISDGLKINVIEDKGILFHKESNNNHTIIIYEVFEAVEKYLKDNKQTINNIYIVNGPGSFTGTRVGVVFAKTLAAVNNYNLIPINYLDVLYQTNNQKVAIDARGKKYFTYDGNEYKVKLGEEIIKADSTDESANNDSKYLIDPRINYNNMNQFLSNLKEKEVDYKEITIEYLKSPI